MIINKLGKGYIIHKNDNSGWVKFYEGKNKITIVFIEVKRKLQNKGIGTSLVKEMIKIANRKNKNIHLTAFATSPEIEEIRLVNFYKKLGFEKKIKHNGTKGVYMIKKYKGVK